MSRDSGLAPSPGALRRQRLTCLTFVRCSLMPWRAVARFSGRTNYSWYAEAFRKGL
jgi:hypothetical protein